MDVLEQINSGISHVYNGNVNSFGAHEKFIRLASQKIDNQNLIKRMFERDVTLWADDDAGKNEAAIRLNWLEVLPHKNALVDDAKKLLSDCLSDGFSHVLLIGMGGSSLAPEVYQSVLYAIEPNQAKRALSLAILDSTDPDQVLSSTNRAPLQKTLFIISSKSGTTTEGDAIFAYLWERCKNEMLPNPGKHFVAITDPGTSLEKIAREKGFRKIFNADKHVGGRFSALIAFGLVPAVLCGLDVPSMLATAKEIEEYCARTDISKNPAASLAAFITGAYFAGANKLTIISDSPIASLGSWLEQLIAESSGKNGKGILPIDGEPLIADSSQYSRDRLFVYLKFDGENEEPVSEIASSGFPVLSMDISTPESLGGVFYLWEAAIAMSCALIGVNAFDQPDVQGAKDATKRNLEFFKIHGKLPEIKPIVQTSEYSIYAHRLNVVNTDNGIDILGILKQVITDHDFVAINAFIERNPENKNNLHLLSKRILESKGVPVTIGFGPRYLHSTGQLHKGGKDEGIFIILSIDDGAILEIPVWNITFKTLHIAQTIGDFEALKTKERRVLWIRCKDKLTLEKLIIS